MKRLLLFHLFFAFCLLSFSQPVFKQWKAEYYADNIIKLTRVTNITAWRNENISDAVILKPVRGKQVRLDAIHKEDRIQLEGRIDITVFDSGEYKGLSFPLAPGEKIFGGGERAVPLNRRGYRLPLYNNPWYGYSEGADALNYSVPFITSSNGYGLFFDNPSKGFIDIGKTTPDRLVFGAVSGEINVYIIFGDYQTILQSYHKLTGTQPLPPRWAMGNLMSRFGYTSEAQVKEVYNKMKDENIPVDAVIFDLFWFGDSIKGTLGNLDWVNKKAWPNPKKMIADFRKDGVNTILVTEPFFLEGTKNYNASKSFLAVDSVGKPYTLTDFYFGRGGLIDIFRNDSKAFFWQFYKKQMLNGVEAWWGDLGEPEKHPSNLYHNLKDFGHKRLFSADEVHNAYGHNWTKMLHDYYKKEYPNKRLFSLNRSGFAGTQRYSIFPWTGDVSRSWSGLRAQLPILLGMSMSGVPYVHSDAGGFAGGEGDPELYVRWLQFAAFTPIFRPHGTALYEVEPAAFSWPSEPPLMELPWRDYARKVINARYAMLPYNYSLAYQQTKFGKPLMAPLYYYFSSDTTATTIQDQYMWGENMMVVPILEKGARTRRYYLPEGNWYNLSDKTFAKGGGWTTDSTSIDKIPLLLKPGGFFVIKDQSTYGNTSKYQASDLSLFYNISSAPSQFQLYNDDGASKQSLGTSMYELFTIQSSGKQGNVLKLKVTKEGKMNAAKNKTFSFFIPHQQGKPKSITVNGKPLRTDGGLFDKDNDGCLCTESQIAFQFDIVTKPVAIEIRW